MNEVGNEAWYKAVSLDSAALNLLFLSASFPLSDARFLFADRDAHRIPNLHLYGKRHLTLRI